MRVRCLEITLIQALKRQESTENPARRGNATTDSVQNQRTPGPAGGEVTNREHMDAFGKEKQARLVTKNDGTEELNDVVSALKIFQPNMWDIILNNGQVWRQEYPKRFGLREGDFVRIRPSRWGDNYRLTTSRLSGFIQVSRVK